MTLSPEEQNTAGKAIPGDIDQIASAIVQADYSSEQDPDYALYSAIARAILAERERCKTIAEKHRSDCISFSKSTRQAGSKFQFQAAAGAADDIAKAIAAPVVRKAVSQSDVHFMSACDGVGGL